MSNKPSRLMNFLHGGQSEVVHPVETKGKNKIQSRPQPNANIPVSSIGTMSSIPASVKEQEVIMSDTAKKTVEVQAEPAITMTFLSPNLKMRDATIESPNEDITVLGSFDGNIRCRHLFVGPLATVSGRIIIDSARVEGKISGNIEGAEVYIMKGGTIEGDLKCKQLGIQPGSTIRAQISCDVTETIQEDITSNRVNMGPVANQPVDFFSQSTMKPQRVM